MPVVISDKALQDLSVMLYDAPRDPTPDVQILSREKLDFSIESLSHVEQYLDHVQNHSYDRKQTITLVLRTGAYVGEVIRRHAKSKQWHWLAYAEAIKLSPDIAKLGKDLHTSAVLWDSKHEFSFPLGKIIKYLRNGEEDDVKFYAQVLTNEGAG
jgi:hypothetical protein